MTNHVIKGLLLTICLFVTIIVISADITSTRRPSRSGFSTRTVQNSRTVPSTSRANSRRSTVRLPTTKRTAVTYTRRRTVRVPTSKVPTAASQITRRPTVIVTNTNRPKTTVLNATQTYRPTRPAHRPIHPKTTRHSLPVLRINAVTGLAEAYFTGDWYPIRYDSGFTTKYLKVLCRTMGRPADFAAASAGPRKSFLVSLYLTCSGDEASISKCFWHNMDFSIDNVARTMYLTCSGLSPEFIVRSGNSGLLKTRVNSAYVPLCADPDYFDNRGAQVLCHKLGLPTVHAMNIYPYQFKLPDMTFLRRSAMVNLMCPNATSPASTCQISTPLEGGYCSTDDLTSDKRTLVAVSCTDQPIKYRLTPMPEYPEIGRLEVRGGDRGWGSVCASSKADKDNHFAEVACKSLNLTSSGAHAYTDVFYGGNITASLYQGDCSGKEDGVGHCASITWGKSCETGAYVGLKCSKAYDGQLRVSGLNGGLVEVYIRDSWKHIGANKMYELEAAEVVCRTLNLSTKIVNYKLSDETQDLGLPSVGCSGNEAKFSQCRNTNTSRSYWISFGKALYVRCDAGMERIRLEKDGLLEVERNSAWGTVCALDGQMKNALTNSNASKICSFLNKSSSLASVVYKPGLQRSGRIAVSGLGFDTIGDIKYEVWTNPKCGHRDDVFVQCDKLERSSVKYRLKTDFFPNVGIFEMSINGRWGAVAMRGDYILRSAQVYCRSIDNTFHTAKYDYMDYLKMRIPTDGKVWLDKVNCSGSEESPLDCAHMYIGDYEHTTDFKPVTVYCGPPLEHPNFSLRLVDGTTTSGRLEVYMFGRWAPLCGSSFTSSEAKVACTQLGFTRLYAKATLDFSDTSKKAWPARIDCSSDEYSSSLSDCAIDQNYEACGISYHVKLSCDSPPFLPDVLPNVPNFIPDSLDDLDYDDDTWGTWSYFGVAGGSGFGFLILGIAIFSWKRRTNRGGSVIQRSPNYVLFQTGNPLTQRATTEHTGQTMLPMQGKGTGAVY